MKEYRNETNFIREIVERDLVDGRHGGRVHTRFPPEPNGYLHIGHAKSICLNFGIAAQYKGLCNLRLDDTNPETEDMEYVESIKKDIKWLGFDWEDRLFFASDYFDKLYEYAIELIKKGRAYVCDLSQEEFKGYRGTVTHPGKESPFRNREVGENIDLFTRMKEGEFPDGSRVLRAKIDMSSDNMLMRDPALYRIKKASHYRTKDRWCIYPTYDFAHCLSDSIEGITHSICTLEFDNNRALYDWILEALGVHHSQQIEFARLNLSHTILSKRKLMELVGSKLVGGWDDPRMPTLSGLRRRGYTPLSIRNFCDRIGVAKCDTIIDMVVLENSLRDELNKTAPRVMGVLRPLKLVIVNYPEDKEEMMEAVNNPEDASMGTRKIPFSRELYIEETDFMERPTKKFFRLAPGKEVRLRYAYFVKCVDVQKDEKGKITEIHCTYDPATRGGDAPDGRRVKGTLHWVSARHAHTATVRLYESLFNKRDPDEAGEGQDFKSNLNPESSETVSTCPVEPGLKAALPGTHYQFERLGYFFTDPADSKPGNPVFNRSVTLKDTWAKIADNEKTKKS
ncbi:MAG: glutamine--tRNA ligase/YqeY domain fusion protein [Candidatus Omnitrophota bacterium]